MRKLTKLLAAFLAVCLMAAASGVAALAAEKKLPDSFLIADENGISVTGAGEYFLYSHNLLPGDVVTRTLTLQNLEQSPFRLHLLGESPRSAGPVDWLDHLHLQILLDGRVLYAGRLRGDGKNTRTMQGNGVDLINSGLDLGSFPSGGSGKLKFVVTADAGHLSAEDLHESSSANITWVFHAVKASPQDLPTFVAPPATTPGKDETTAEPSGEEIILSGKKTWNHGANPVSKRPASITVIIKADGAIVVQRLITAADHWAWSFTLPKYNGDKEITYTVDEARFEDYIKTVDGYNITNTYKLGANTDDTNSGDSGSLPRTDDSGNLALWMTIMVLSLGGLAAVIIIPRRKRREKNCF